MNKKILIGIGIIVFVVVLFFIFNKSNSTGNVVAGSEFVDEGETIKIPLSKISGKARFYNYEGIRFFAVKADDGTVKTAFDACDVCYRSRKGYSQKGEDMVCNNCDNRYPISGLGTRNLRGGGCWPGYLPRDVEREYLIIKKDNINKGAYRFP